MKSIALILIGIFSAVLVQAAPKIEQVDPSRARIAATSDKNTTLGSEWMVTKKDGTQCVFVVDNKIGKLAVLKPLSCDNLSDIKVGQRLTKNLLSSASATSPLSNQSRVISSQSWRGIRESLRGFSVIGFYSMADDVPFKVQNTSVTAIGETAFGFGAEYEHFLGDALVQGLPFSVVGGITYELSREFGSQRVGAQTGTLNPKPAFSMWDFYANAKLNLTNNVAALGGFNYPIAREENFDGEKLKSSLGYQLGATAKVTDQLGLDAMYRWVNLRTASLSDMELNGFVLRGRYIF